MNEDINENINEEEKLYNQALAERAKVIKSREVEIAKFKRQSREHKAAMLKIDQNMAQVMDKVLETRWNWSAARDKKTNYDLVTPAKVSDWIQNYSGYTSKTIHNIPVATVRREYEAWAKKPVRVSKFNKAMLDIGLRRKNARILGYMAQVYYKPEN